MTFYSIYSVEFWQSWR